MPAIPRAQALRALPLVDGRPVARLLIVKPSSLGDVVQALPVATALRRAYPALHLSWAVEARFAPLVRQQGLVDRVVELPTLAWGAVDRDWPAALRVALAALRRERADLVLDLQGLLKSAVLALAAGAPLRLGVAPQREGSRLVARPVPLPPEARHAVDTYLAAAHYLGAAPWPVDFALRPEPGAAAVVARRLAARRLAAGARLVVINPASARAAKRWPAAHWAAAIAALAGEATVVLIGGAAQRAAHAVLAATAAAPVVDLTGETSLSELVALLARCAVHVAADTGTLHLAAALGRPVVGIYGPTPVARFAPWGQSAAALSGASACGVGCPRVCLRRRRCLTAIAPAAVVAGVRRALAGG